MVLSNTKVTGSVPIQSLYRPFTKELDSMIHVSHNSECSVKSVKTLFKTKKQNPQGQQ